MADNKRQSVGARGSAQGPTGGAAGQGATGAMVPLEVALSRAIGARVRISTAPVASTIEGTLFTADPITNLVAIDTADGKQSQTGDYRIIPISRIQSVQILSLAPSATTSDGPSFADAVPPLHALDIRSLKNREANAIAKAHESEARRGKGVTREAQDIFDAFSRTMPARWDGAKIIVADAVSIAAPYRVDDCRSLVAGDTAALARVRKVLEMERKKIELRNASAAIGPGAAGQRKGG
ncbi:hypothetical protein BO82DRAFT_343272 [Aspergillus uvarum CBS 121591]|uniref:AD domain-containing protein n=1 Tax=Aspergillus uvarum CBS 121591 TaxID=1448315 RepID=A0A319BWT5_9EURO|nr:hypothetical protein BO82DRAFT_343272 [Aspergillus uvarum CBS 121591]PYH78156.1 hypothetical protein BO82DRAFT_343272 [Aspergillus uvarum CBS 121591]